MSTDREVMFALAGRTVRDAVGVVGRYVDRHGGTIEHYDYVDRDPNVLTPGLVKATRSPWMGSRISRTQEEWFIEQARTAPWDRVPPDSRLCDADPINRPGFYDDVGSLYRHFADGAPAGTGVAKVSKVLHLMRPHLYPILDSRLCDLYRSRAREAATAVCARRPDIGSRRLFWEAIRLDLIENSEALRALRTALSASTCGAVAEVGRRLSDVRLLDICTWSIPSPGRTK